MKDPRFEFAIPLQENLLSYGFKKQGEELFCSFDLDPDFVLEVHVFNDNKTDIRVIEKEFNEEYPLIYLDTSNGEFIYNLREKMDTILDDILAKCYQKSLFLSKQGRMIATYLKEKHNDDLVRFASSPVCYYARRKDSQRWYLLLIQIKKSKLGFKGDDSLVEIIDIKGDVKDIDNTYIFPGYHMNKKHWITILLDNGFSFDDLLSFIDYSYQLNG